MGTSTCCKNFGLRNGTTWLCSFFLLLDSSLYGWEGRNEWQTSLTWTMSASTMKGSLPCEVSRFRSSRESGLPCWERTGRANRLYCEFLMHSTLPVKEQCAFSAEN